MATAQARRVRDAPQCVLTAAPQVPVATAPQGTAACAVTDVVVGAVPVRPS
ncbi:hypothetical protein ACGFYP_02545 [Streptomyces sp. NPDC048370]|uniref:hypothetical protein n=1 Tax=Streptomyces sp. NPDC048370 TaxID=3365540 RepID=UPI00371D2F68